MISGGTPGGKRLNKILNKYGFSPSDEKLDADHVKEIQVGGKDEVGNLWPLDESINRGAGKKLSNAQAKYPNSRRFVSISELKRRVKKYFLKIIGFDY